MAANKLKIMLSFMKEISNENAPHASDYDIPLQEYWEIVEACQNEGYIKDVLFIRGGQGNNILIAFPEKAKLTVKGMQYIQENNKWFKLYKGVKEFREWLPF